MALARCCELRPAFTQLIERIYAQRFQKPVALVTDSHDQ